MSNNFFKIGVVIVAVAAIVGGYFFPKVVAVGSSPAGTSFGTAKIASQQVQTSTSTVFSQLNSDANARMILGSDVLLTGSGAATSTGYNFACATSTVGSFNQGNTNYVLNYTIVATPGSPYGTTTNNGVSYMATSSPGIMGTTSPTYVGSPVPPVQFARIWPAGTYLNCILTTSVGSNDNLLDSNVSGTITFPYRGQ